MPTQQEILTIFREELRSEYPDIGFQDGYFAYDMMSPLSYVVGKSFSVLESNQNMSILTASEEVLTLWAEPRIGKKYPGTYTTIIIEGKDIYDDQWTLSSNNQYIFTTTTVNDDSTKVLTATVMGYIPVVIGDQVTSVATLQKAKIIAVTLGKDEETTENYRTRYLESIFLDAQAGTITYIKNHVMMHEKVGYAGVDYITSSTSNYSVFVYVTGVDYLPVSSELLIELKNYFDNPKADTNITPFGQSLEFKTFSPYNISVQINIKKVILPLTEAIVLNYLNELNKTVYVPSIFNTDDLKITLDQDDLRNKFSSQFSEYGVISSILLNNSTENIVLDKAIPIWESVTINVLEES